MEVYPSGRRVPRACVPRYISVRLRLEVHTLSSNLVVLRLRVEKLHQVWSGIFLYWNIYCRDVKLGTGEEKKIGEKCDARRPYTPPPLERRLDLTFSVGGG